MKLLKSIENIIVSWAYKVVDKRKPVKIDDLVRHNMTGLDGHVIGVQYQGWSKPKCFLTVKNNITDRLIVNIDRNEFTHAVQLRLIDPRNMNLSVGRNIR